MMPTKIFSSLRDVRIAAKDRNDSFCRFVEYGNNLNCDSVTRHRIGELISLSLVWVDRSNPCLLLSGVTLLFAEMSTRCAEGRRKKSVFVTHGACAKSPNDPKLSDRGVRRGTCTAGGKAAAEAGAVTRGAVRWSDWLN